MRATETPVLKNRKLPPFAAIRAFEAFPGPDLPLVSYSLDEVEEIQLRDPPNPSE